jgi:carbamate kinase
MVEAGHRVVITHGNGPQVGAILLQNEEARGVVPAMPLDICGAESQGLIGYMIQQSLRNLLKEQGIRVPVATVVTQVLVDEKDPAFENPTKPVGPFYNEEVAKRLAGERGFIVREDSGRGWRRVVPSPDPKGIVEEEAIKLLVESGAIVIASGGGGIPVVKQAGKLVGVEAVIDKDLAGERLATAVKANILLILTDVDGAALNYGTAEERFIGSMTTSEASRYLADGHFAAGSMGPKVLAAIRFLENGGQSCLIASLERAWEALQDEAGTRITP